MTRDEIIKMAREAGFEIGVVTDAIFAPASCRSELERFATLVANHEREQCSNHYLNIMRKAIKEEREACAKVCDAEQAKNESDGTYLWEAKRCAAAIRARGQT